MFEAFAIGVSLRLMDRVSPGLLGMTTHFRKAGVEAELLQTKIAKIGKTMAVGTAMTGAGIGILATLKPAITEAAKFQTQVAKYSLYGMGDRANAEAVRFAKSMRVIGSSYVDNMALLTESQGIFRESGKRTLVQQLEGAKLAAPILAKLSFIESSLSDDKRAAAHTQDLAMLRFIESRGGANDPRTFAGIADWGFKLSKSSGGVVPWSQLQQLAATSGIAGFNLSQNAIAKLEPVVADLTGGRTGSGLRVAFQRLLGTQRGLPVQAISEMLKLGLWDPTKVALKSGGGIDHFIGRPGSVLREGKLFATDPAEFYQRVFLPAIAKKYGSAILGDSVQARTERAVETNLVFGPGTAGAVFAQLDKLAPAIARSVAAQSMTKGIDAAMQAAGNTLAGKRIAARKAFDDTLELTGEAILPLATRAMGALLPAIQKVNAFATAHPRMFDGIIKGIAGLGVAMVAGGVITNLVATGQALKLVGGLAQAAIFAKDVGLIARSAGLLTAGFELAEVAFAGLSIAIGAPVGVIVGAGVAIAAAVAGIGVGLYEMWRHWDNSRTVFQNLKYELGLFVDWVKGIPGAIWNKVPGWLRKVLSPWGKADGAPGAAAVPKPSAPKPAPTYLQANGRLDVRATADFIKKGGHFIVPADWAREHPAAIAAGRAVGQGVAQGVVAAHPAVRAAAAGSAGQAVAGFKAAADIHSPSRVFASLGDQLIAGLIVGVDRSAGVLMARMGGLARGMAAPFRDHATVFGSGPLGLSLNNPGNLRRWGDAARVHGFAAFHTAADGLHAMGHQLQLYAARGLNTVSSIISRWAPASENATGAYIAAVSRATGFGAHQRLNLIDTHQLSSLMGAMIRREQGRSPYSADEIAKAVAGNLTRSPYVRPAETHTTVHHTQIHMDGRKVAEVVTHHQARETRRPQASSSHFDPTMAPMWPGQRVAPA